jgi:hypothetical protein
VRGAAGKDAIFTGHYLHQTWTTSTLSGFDYMHNSACFRRGPA